MDEKYWEKGLTKAAESMVQQGFEAQRKSIKGAQLKAVEAFAERQAAYSRNPRLCGCCSTPLSYFDAVRRKKKFCSTSCAAKVNNKGRKRDQLSRAKTSIAVRRTLGTINSSTDDVITEAWARAELIRTCEHCKAEFKKKKWARQRFCSENCSSLAMKKPPEVRKQNQVKNVIEWRRRLKQRAVEYKGGHCQLCGYHRSIRALEFHHINPDEKDFSIGGKGVPRRWETVKKELDKCLLLCANCHREVHEEGSQFPLPMNEG